MNSLKHFPPRIVLSVLFAAILLGNIYSMSHASAQTSGPTGIIVPLYIYPGSDWNTLISVKSNHTSVPIIAIVNPASGVGKVKDPNYVDGIKKLKAAGITVVGYIWTNYASRNITKVKIEIDRYKNWYGVNGIFFDAMSTKSGKEWYYKNLNTYAKSKGLAPTVGNPGTATRQSYFGTMDNLIIYEGSGTPSLEYLGGWSSRASKNKFSFIAYDVLLLDEKYVVAASNHVRYMYLTHDTLNNPYDSLPIYLSQLVSVLGNANNR